MKYDLAIIGGGPAGYTAAERAADGGLKVLLFEERELGGVCLNVGCIPTKTLLNSAKYLDHARNAKSYGVEIVGEVTHNYKRMMARKNKVVKKLVAGVAYRMTSGGIEVVKERAEIVGDDGTTFKLRSASGAEYESTYLIVATGSRPAVPPITGTERGDYWTSTDALNSKEQPTSIAIIGAGVVGMEFASFFNSIGTKVTVIEMLPEILGTIDREVAATLRKIYEKEGVTFHLNTKVVELLPNGVKIEKDGTTEEIEAEKTLLSVGRRANVQGFGLETLGLEMERNGVQVDRHLQTSHPRVYAVGDVTGYSMLAHTGIREAEIAVEHLLGGEDEMSYLDVPGVVYTNPEVAGVGYTEEQLKAEGRYYRVLQLPMQYSGRFVAENEAADGLCKILVDENGLLLGAHMLGNPASEIIYGLGIAIKNKETVEGMKRHIYPHPTVAEIIHEVIQ